MNAKCFWQNNFFVTGFCNAIAQTMPQHILLAIKNSKNIFSLPVNSIIS
jgi:hypothetical protein